MATSIPKARDTASSAPQTTPETSLDFHLSYEGKRDSSEILRTSPTELTPLPLHGAGSDVATTNRLYYGENLGVLATLLSDPSLHGQVRLVYIDPPYATGGVFESRSQQSAYEDLLVGAHFIEFLRERLILIRELLAEDGSIYIHLDRNMAFAIKLIMDEVFGPRNFRSWITRKKCNPKNYTSKTYGNVADFLLFYSKTDNYVWNRPTEAWTDERSKEYQYVDNDGRRYMKVPVHAPGVRNGETGKPWRGKLPPAGKHWQYLPSKLDEMDAQGLIYWSPNGNPRRKVFLDTSSGVPVQDIWLDFRDAHNQNVKITGFPTEKNPALLERIVRASSNPNDLVLDCFGGSGTTMAVAEELGRRWIGVDRSQEAIRTTLRRFQQGTAAMGDFVGKEITPSLQFALPLDTLDSVRPVEVHRPIKDFTVYVPAGNTDLDDLKTNVK